MIVYRADKGKFIDDVLSGSIDDIILKYFKKNLKRGTSESEVRSWRESMSYMDRVLRDDEIPENCGVAIEYQIPQTSKRIDFTLSGKGDNGQENAIIIELKQWSTASMTDMDGIVKTFVGGGVREVTHPSYQAWTYASLLESFNQTVYEENIRLAPCAFLHNYQDDDVMRHPFYQEHLDKAPVFLRTDILQLRAFIKQYVKHGDDTDILYRIENGKLKPSKLLADSIVSMLVGNDEFTMIDDQKIVYETALSMFGNASADKKKVLIVEGGPGTGKSVVAVNLLVELTHRRKLAQYVSKNAAPRKVYEAKLTGTFKATVIRNMFKGSGSYVGAEANLFDALIVDEAHRLNEFSGLYGNLGENQIKEIMHASKFSVFFIDEDQRVTLKDIGEKDAIRKFAEEAGAEVQELELASQFRCNGSDGYLAWLDNVLQIRETANESVEDLGFDFQVVDSPALLRDMIFEKNEINNRSRLVAGYCWNWITKKHPEMYDIQFPEYNFRMKWNLTKDGSLWIISPDSVNKVGCIHTCQGLEVDYVGVIIGDDLIVRNGEVITRPAKRARTDMSLRGYARLSRDQPVTGPVFLDQIIKNTYRTLMTRGMKGCYVYCTDRETREWLKGNVTSPNIL